MLKINIILKENKIKSFNGNNKNTCFKIFWKTITKGNSTTLVFLILSVAYTGLIRSEKKISITITCANKYILYWNS